MHEGKVKITDIQISLGHVFTFVFGLGGALVGLAGALLFLGNLLYVDKKEFAVHKEDNLKCETTLTQKVEKVNDVVERALLRADTKKNNP
jgi:hypothetical protein